MKIIFPSLISMWFLIIAVFPIPEYNFYILLRWIICSTAIYIAYNSYKSKKIYWSWIMGIVALTFNPTRAFHFEKDTWSVIDLAAAILFGITILIFRVNKKKRIR